MTAPKLSNPYPVLKPVKYRAVLAYDGTRYQGFQRQAEGVPTIQAAVETAISAITGQSVTVMGAGRTDSGVHATGQVIGFSATWQHSVQAFLQAINASLPADIALQSLAEEPDERFHPRFSAVSRRYSYTILQTPQRQPLLINRAWHYTKRLKLDEMQFAAQMLIGEHDFATFGHPPQGTNTIRRLYQSRWEWQEDMPEQLIYHIEATAFLQHMVRRIVGMLVDVGRGRLTVAQFEECFRQADLTLSKTIAPPQGLILEAVRYPDPVIDQTMPVNRDQSLI